MISQLVHRTLTPEISPMVYVMMGISLFIGFCFGFNVLVAGSESVLYSAGVLVHKQGWGIVLLITALMAEIGFVVKSDFLIKLGGISGFMAWLFACIALALQAHWYIFVTVGLFHLIFHGYVVLAVSLGYIRRQAIS